MGVIILVLFKRCFLFEGCLNNLFAQCTCTILGTKEMASLRLIVGRGKRESRRKNCPFDWLDE